MGVSRSSPARSLCESEKGPDPLKALGAFPSQICTASKGGLRDLNRSRLRRFVSSSASVGLLVHPALRLHYLPRNSCEAFDIDDVASQSCLKNTLLVHFSRPPSLLIVLSQLYPHLECSRQQGCTARQPPRLQDKTGTCLDSLRKSGQALAIMASFAIHLNVTFAKFGSLLKASLGCVVSNCVTTVRGILLWTATTLTLLVRMFKKKKQQHSSSRFVKLIRETSPKWPVWEPSASNIQVCTRVSTTASGHPITLLTHSSETMAS